jgi:molybdopterin-guanine dinucleotide biosynthesis protein A
VTSTCKTDSGTKKPSRFTHNPFEVAVCGGEEAWRSALVAQLFEGAFPNRSVYATTEGKDEFLHTQDAINADFAIIAASDDVPMAKIVWTATTPPKEYSEVIAFVGPKGACPVLPATTLFYSDDDIAGIAQCIRDHFKAQIDQVPLYGLVLAGGKSMRMKQDKAALAYHGKPQVLHAYDQLNAYCDEVFVSLRRDQGDEAIHRDVPQIHDSFIDMGPMGGILSALKARPGAAWLVLACDLPFVTEDTLGVLLKARDPFRLATAFRSSRDDLPEPLCAIYEPKSIHRLLSFLGLGFQCPRKVLINSRSLLLEPAADHALANVNYPEEFDAAVAAIQQKDSATIS